MSAKTNLLFIGLLTAVCVIAVVLIVISTTNQTNRNKMDCTENLEGIYVDPGRGADNLCYDKQGRSIIKVYPS